MKPHQRFIYIPLFTELQDFKLSLFLGEQGWSLHRDRTVVLLHLSPFHSGRHDVRSELEPTLLQKRRRRYSHSTGQYLLIYPTGFTCRVQQTIVLKSRQSRGYSLFEKRSVSSPLRTLSEQNGVSEQSEQSELTPI